MIKYLFLLSIISISLACHAGENEKLNKSNGTDGRQYIDLRNDYFFVGKGDNEKIYAHNTPIKRDKFVITWMYREFAKSLTLFSLDEKTGARLNPRSMRAILIAIRIDCSSKKYQVFHSTRFINGSNGSQYAEAEDNVAGWAIWGKNEMMDFISIDACKKINN
jgi:hypothetical protein